jgi:hypothetical protein
MARSRARWPLRGCWTTRPGGGAGIREPRDAGVVGEALECLRELGWIRPEAVITRDGGRPTVRFQINPRGPLSEKAVEVLSVLSVGVRHRTPASLPPAARTEAGVTRPSLANLGHRGQYPTGYVLKIVDPKPPLTCIFIAVTLDV